MVNFIVVILLDIRILERKIFVFILYEICYLIFVFFDLFWVSDFEGIIIFVNFLGEVLDMLNM